MKQIEAESLATTVNRHAAKATFSTLDDGVSLMRLTGPVTTAAVLEFNRQVVRVHPHAIGWVYDYRRALLVASDADLTMLSKAQHPDPHRRPAAFVVTPEIEASLRKQALRMARQGYDRRVFLSVEAAHDWIVWMASRA